MKFVYIVYKQTELYSSQVVKVFEEERFASVYCKDQNDLHDPDFDEWGFIGGVHHTYQKMAVE